MDERYRGFDKLAKLVGDLTLTERLEVLVKLSKEIDFNAEDLKNVMERTYLENKWFTFENQQKALEAIKENFLSVENLKSWVRKNPNIQSLPVEKKTIAIVMAGNIPLVGFHDLICVFVAGFRSLIKLSDKDKLLLPFLVQKMIDIDSRCEEFFNFSEKLSDFDGVIATGSNNTSRYFEAYFGKYPNIIRKNRNSIAILDGTETKEDMIALGHDIFEYFGLGCRNVSKIYVPKGYDFNNILEVWHDEFKEMILHDKYKNNFDYNYALFMLNRIPLFNNGCVILREEKVLSSRIASLHYEFYDDLQILENELLSIENQLQCVSTKIKFNSLKTVKLGDTQSPSLIDYADGVDVMRWLTGLS